MNECFNERQGDDCWFYNLIGGPSAILVVELNYGILPGERTEDSS